MKGKKSRSRTKIGKVQEKGTKKAKIWDERNRKKGQMRQKWQKRQRQKGLETKSRRNFSIQIGLLFITVSQIISFFFLTCNYQHVVVRQGQTVVVTAYKHNYNPQ